MLRHPLRWSFVFLVIAGMGVLIFWYTRPLPLDVVVKPVERGTVEQMVANTRAGSVKACQRARLSPSIGGQISLLPVGKGERVKKGQLLLELWNEDLKAQTLLAREEISAARHRARSVCLRAAVARRNADRILALRRENFDTEERRDNSAVEAAALEAECEGARVEIRVGEARLKAAGAALLKTRLEAPFDGVIADINGELSEFVTPSPLGIATFPVVDIINTTCFYVTAPIDEIDAAGIVVGMAVRITMDAFGDRLFMGRVQRIADYVLDVEKQARTVDVEVAFDMPGDVDLLLAGYSADVEIILERHPDVVRVPTEAVVDGSRVFVFVEDPGVIAERRVQTGLSNWDWTEVMEGLVPGERVVVNADRPGLAEGAPAVLSRGELNDRP